jgi:hypothetical protein
MDFDDQIDPIISEDEELDGDLPKVPKDPLLADDEVDDNEVDEEDMMDDDEE